MLTIDKSRVTFTPAIKLVTSPEELYDYLSGAERLRLGAVRLAVSMPHPCCRYIRNGQVCLAHAYPLTFLDRRLVVLICGNLVADLDFRHCVLLAGTMSPKDPWRISTYMLALDGDYPNDWGFGNDDSQSARNNPALIMAFAGWQLAEGHFRRVSMAK